MKVSFDKIYTKSNLISFFRLLLVFPAFILLDKIEESSDIRYWMVGLYFFAYLTDLLDGFLARKYNEISEFGKVMDPLADKVLIGMIVIKLYLIGEIPAVYFWIVILRDIIIFSGGVLVTKKIGKVLPSNLLGKITVTSIGFFIIAVTLNISNTSLLYNLLFYLSLSLSFISVIGYAIRGYDSIKWNKNETI